jgi:hypothetical protein
MDRIPCFRKSRPGKKDGAGVMVILIGAASFALISLISLEYMELPEQRLFIFLAGHDVIYGILS